MGKDKRPWRKLVKKLRRQKKRQLAAQARLTDNVGAADDSSGEECGDEAANEGRCGGESQGKVGDFFLSSMEWEERETECRLATAMKQAEEDRLAEIQEAKQKQIREEWEARQEQERKVKEEKERLEKVLREKQEAEFTEFLDFLSGDIETPPTRYLMPDTQVEEADLCHYFARTGACRFYGRCTKTHPQPTLSTAILIPNFFSHFKLEQSIRDEYDSDLGLEYDDTELYNEFLEFYNDVLPELQKHGTVLQFKVCCNLEPHLRGNVYLQYETIKQSIEAFRKFNGRYYNGRQLSIQFVKIDSWRSAICGSYLRKACIKGRTCNYLHVFRNPTKEFVRADYDWKEHPRKNQVLGIETELATSSSCATASARKLCIEGSGPTKSQLPTSPPRPSLTNNNDDRKSQTRPSPKKHKSHKKSSHKHSSHKHTTHKHKKSKKKKNKKHKKC